MILIEITAAVDAAGTLSTFYLTDSASGFVTSPTDTPANTVFLPALVDPGSIGIHAYSDGRTGGGTRLEVGEVTIANADGAFDAWLNYSFDGRPITNRSGSVGAYPGAFTPLFAGTVDSIEATWKTTIIRLRDKQFVFQKPALTTRYAGSNALPNGLEGTASDIGGKVKPKVYGKVFNVSPPCVNTSKLAYQVNDGAVSDIPAVYDRGAALTKGADYATSALMLAAVPAAGSYITCFAEGYFMLGSSPAGQITADVTQGAAAGNRTVAQIIKQLALDAGLSAGEISSSDVTTLDTANSAVVGLWLSDENTTFLQAMDQVAASIGAWFGFDGPGVLRMGQLSAPSGSPVVTLYDYDIRDGFERKTPADNSIPVYRVTVNHSRIWTVQSSDIAGAVTTATRARLAEEFLSQKAEDTSIKTQWLLAKELEVSGLLTSATDATNEASRLLALHKVRRDVFEATVSIDIMTDNNLKLMDVVAVQLSRFGLDAGKSFRLIGYKLDLSKGQAILNLWG